MRGIAAFFLWNPFCCRIPLLLPFFAVGSFLLLDSLAAASCFESFFPYRFKTEMKDRQLISSKSICLEIRNFCRLLSQSVSALLSRVKDL